MSDAPVVHVRPDVDIQKAIISVITQYPPTAADRHTIHVSVQDGAVVLSGHVRTPINRRYLLNEIPKIDGVRAVDSSTLYDDESIRIETGQRVPPGVLVSVRYGTVALTGSLPHGTELDTLAAAIAAVPGVQRVVASIDGS